MPKTSRTSLGFLDVKDVASALLMFMKPSNCLLGMIACLVNLIGFEQRIPLAV